MHRRPWTQLLLVAALGGCVGLAYRRHRAAEIEWSSTHYRMDEKISFPMNEGIPFPRQYVLDARGRRIELPPEDGAQVDFHGAAWWSIDAAGRVRTWNEERVEVFPTLVPARR